MEDTKHHFAVFLGFVTLVVPVLSQIPPSPPTLTGPNIITEGDNVTLVCTTFGGDPIPTVKWYEGNVLLDESQTDDASGLSTNVFTFTVTKADHLAVYECRVDNNVLQNPLASTWFIQVYSVPKPPVLTGPSVVISGTPNQWTCVSLGGYPKPTMKLSYDTTVFPTTSITETTKYDAAAVSYNNTKVVTWSPTTANNGATIYCEVNHPTIPNKPQITSLKITVNLPLAINAPQLTYTPTLGTNLVLVCNVTGVATSVSWYKDNSPTPIIIANNARLSNGNVNIPSLGISNAQTSDSGQYVCQATDGTKTVNTNTITVTVQFKPTVTIQQPTYSVNYADPVTLVCTVFAIPFQTKVYWQKDNTLIINSGDPGYSGGTPAIPSLTINSAITKDQGQYRCFAENPVGSGNSSLTTVTVIGGLLSVSIPQPSYSVVLGTSSVKIDCTVTGTPSATSVSWTKIQGGQTTDVNIANSNGKYQGGSVTTPSLTITNVAQSDKAYYVCSATNLAGTSSSQQAFLDVTGSIPVVQILKPSYTVNYASPVTLECTVTASPLHTSVTWQKIVNGQPTTLNLGTRYSGGTVSTPSLTILSTNLGDPGVYRCLATNLVGTGQSQDTSLTIVGDYLTVVIPQPSYTAVIGTNSLTITCQVSGVPSANVVTWTKTVNNVPTNIDIANSNGKYQGGTVNNPSLTITNIVLSDEANYVCIATNLVGPASSQPAFLDVTGEIPTVTVLKPTYSVLYGNTVTLECTVTANPLHTVVVWQKFVNGQFVVVSLTNSPRYSGSTVSMPSLTISNTVTSDSGVYKCTATNVVGTGQSQNTTLTVTGGLLMVVIPQPSYSAILGSSSVTIGCIVSGQPSATSIGWSKITGGQTTNVNISNSNGKYQGGSLNTPSLTILNVAQSDEANYVCSATNIAGTASSQQAFLDVTGSLPVVTIRYPTYSSVYGESVTLECTVTADPLHTIVFWQKMINGQPSDVNVNSAMYSGSTVSTPSLTILSTTSADTGVYRCLATNAVGTGQSQDTKLTVNGGLLSATIPQQTYTVVLGSNNITIDCIVSGIPAAFSVGWIKSTGGQQMDLDIANSNGKYQGGTVGNPSLTILKIVQNDEANYICKATNIAGTAFSQQAFLDVTGSIPEVTILSPRYRIVYGNPVTLQCVVTASPLHTVVFWQKIVNGQATNINLSNTAKYSGSTVGTPSLTILGSVSADTGIYRCLATNVVGTGQSQDTTVTVDGGLLNVTIPQMSYSAVLGSSSVRIDCIVNGIPSATSVSWTKITGGQTTDINFSSNTAKYQGGTVSNPSLTIINIVQSDEANYVCSARNIAGTVSSQQAFLDVTGNIPVVTIASLKYSVLYGNSVALECTVTADPLHNIVFWEKIINGQPSSINLINNVKYSGSTVSSPSLAISSVDKTDTGLYRCSATNIVGTGQSQDTTLTVTGDLLNVQILKNTYTVLIGSSSVTIDCTVSGTPSATSVTWKKTLGGQTTNLNIANSNGKYQGGSVNNPSLTITNIAQSDEANYVCSATNIVGSADSQSAFLDVTGNPPTVTILQPTYSVLYGNTITLECTVTASPIHTIVSWQKIVNGQPTAINQVNTHYTGGTVSTPSLTIQNTVKSDSGVYRCLATNLVGTGQSQDTTLTVTGDPPVATIGAPNYQVLVGNTITIGCTVTANPVVQNVYWERNIGGSVITIGPTTNPSKYGGSTTVNPSLTINNVDFSDEGNYRCFATNIVGTGNSNQGFLDVFGLPPTVTVTLPNYQVDFGNTVTLGCTVTANPVHTTVYWKKIVNGVTTNVNMQTSNNKYSGSTVSSPSLVINNANLDDRASYVCYAENSIGVGQSTTTVLNVLGEIPKVVVAQPQYNTDYGKSVTLVCTVTANPIHTIVYWQKIQNGVTNTINVASSNNKYAGSTVSTPSLTINNAVLSDKAIYICFATNGVGTGQSSQTYVDVNGGLPLVAVLSNSYSVVVGGTVTLQCVVNANPAHTVVKWQKIVNGVITDVILSSNNRLSGSTVSTPSLTVSQADFSDEGNYICTATNPVGTGTSQQTFLDVTGTPPVATVSQSLYQGNYAQSVTLVCSVIATPTASKVYWKRLQNGQMTDISLTNTAKYSGSTVGSPSLTISDLNLNDEGFYQCFADNSVGTGSSQQTFLDVLGNIPTVKVLSNAYNVIVGNTVTLGCQVDATPKETIVFWQRLINGQLTNIDLATNNNNKYSGSKVGTPSLTITNAQNSDEGNYICYATNLAGTGSSSQTFLDVVGSPPVVSIAQSSYSVNIGNPVTLFCTVSATPPEFKVYWTRKIGNQAEELITTTNSGKYSGSTVNSPSLVILQTDLSDIASYKCFAENSVGIGQSNTTTLNVLGNPPIVTIEKSTYTVNYGNTVTLTCTVTSQPLHTSVYWKKVQGGQQVPVDMTSSKYSGSTVTMPSLTISNTNSNDETFYICYATNIIGTGQSSQTYLDVLGSQPDVKVLSNSYAVLTGQTATLECVITANPAASSVQWYKVVNGQQQAVTATPGKYNTPTVNSPNLIVYNAQSSDKGYYVCSATNIVATASSAQTFLDVTGNPPVVTISLPNYATKEGTTVTLGCTVIASPAATRVYWARVDANGQTSQININNNKYSGSSVTNPSLTIFNPILSDKGNYICYAENVIGLGSSQKTYLDVTGSIPTVTVAKSLYTVDINQPVTLECTVVASPVHTAVYWQRIVNGVATTIAAGSQTRYSGSTVTVPSLTISSVEFSDEAYYVCFATNEVGTGQSAQTYLDVVGSRPIVNIGSTSYSVNYANTITLVCTVSANPLHTSVSWTKIKNGISTNIVIGTSGKYSGSTVAQPSLTITNAVNDDEAFYVCSATNLVGTGQSSQTYLDVVGEIPVVQILSNYYSVEIGKSVTVECQVQANPAHTSVQWQRVVNGQVKPLDISNISKYTGGIVKTPSLTILNTVDSDEGYYICTATNVVGTGSSTQSYVDVTGSVLSVTIPQPSYSVNYGQDVQLVCTVSGSPAATAVYWEKTKNGVITRIDANTNINKYSGSTTATPSLTVRNADSTDQAVYTCFAENVIGRGQSSQTQLQIIGSIPSVTIGTGYTVNLGNSITIKCTVFATPSATSVEWNKFANGVPYKIDIASQPNKYSGGSVNTPSLTINNAVDSDEAYYTCSATNAAGTGTSTQSYLDVLGSIPVVTISQPQYSVVVGNSVTMQCSITANPAHNQVMWKKIINGSPVDVPLGGRYTGSTVANPSLTITNATDADKGYYVCYATNSVGLGQSAQTYLNVVGSIPVVTVLSTSYSVNIANSITLQCTVTANPAATTVKWQRIVNNVAVNIDMSNTRYSGSTVASPSLVISNVASGDKGFYICLASNSVGTGQSSQTFLDVVGSIPQVIVPVPNYSVNRGASITLECSYTANPAATSVSWEKFVSGQATSVVMSTTNNKYGGSTVQSPSLIINAATESDEASYICKVTNDIGTGISTATALDVVGNIPVVTALPLAYSVNVGSSVTLGCTVVADPVYTSVQWKKIVGGVQTNIVVSSSGGKYGGATVGSPSLVINNAAFSDQGTYMCYATNSVGTGMSTQVVVAVAGSPPIVTLSQNSFSANYGESVTLGCVISADPKETSVYWQKVVAGNAPVTIDLTNTAKYSGSTVIQPGLTIKDVGSGDIASYICFAANSIGTGQSSQGPLTVAGSAPTVRISQTTYSINIGNTITIDCTVISKPSHTTVYWTRQIGTNQPETITTTGSTSTKYGGSTILSPSLTIYNVQESDQGTYICHATNIVGTGHSSQAFLDVVGNAPVVTATSVSSTPVGSAVTIQCTVVANPPAVDIIWSKFINNQPTPIDIINNKRMSGGTKTNPSLTINPVEQDDEGNYICQARNDVGVGSSNQVFVDVTGDPPTLVAISPTKITIVEGETITAKCTAQGTPPPKYSWFREGSTTVIATTAVYEVVNAPRTAIGTYICRASNNYGYNEATVIVDVQYKPNVTISKTTTSFYGSGRQSINIPCTYVSNPAATSVFWTKMLPATGSATTGNTNIIKIDGTKYQGGTLNSPSLTIYNLDKSDEGSYRCSASNSIGQGDSNYVTLGVNMNAAPSYIRITPSTVTVDEGNGYTLTCEADGDPTPLFEWYYKDVKIYEGSVLTIASSAYIKNDGLHTCKATNKIGSRQATVDVDVQYAPITNVKQSSFAPHLNEAVTLQCDTRANPSATSWSWKYNGFSLDYYGKVYLVDMDSTADVGKYTCIAYNEVGQSEEIDFTVSLGVGPTPAPKIVETVVSAGYLTGGEIAAICLAVLFGLLLIVIIIVCCVVQGCCRRRMKPEKERYIERVVTREAEIPTAVVREPSVVSVRELVAPRISYVDDSYRYLTTSARPYYLPVVEATYDDDEHRRRTKKKKKSKRYHEDLALNDGIYLEERVIGSVRGSRKGEEIITGPEMYFEAE